MVVNFPLILVSALFFLALCSILYMVTWLISLVIFKLASARITHVGSKRILMTALVLPPILAAVPTFDGATFKHDHHATLGAEHHNMACQQIFARFSDMTTVHGNVAAGIVLNGFAWTAAAVGIALVVRLITATIRLEHGLAPYLLAPTPKLRHVLDTVSHTVHRVPVDRFYECAIPAAYSSVFGILNIRCILSRDFVESATTEELTAVVAHEASHLLAKDVWATLLVGTLNCLFFAIRPVRLLGRQWRRAAELACDDAAVNVTKNPLAMASAILRVSGVSTGGAASIRNLPATTLAFADELACTPSLRVERLISKAIDNECPHNRTPKIVLIGSWAFTGLASILGLAMLISPEASCYAHCSLEAIAKVLP